MKLKNIFSGIMALVMGAAVLTACSDSDDYYANKTPLLTDGSVVTGSSDVTATSATMYGTVAGLEKMNTASYATGFYYGTSENALTETLPAQSAGEFSGSISGLMNGTVIYYQAYVTLQGRITYKGEVKSLITTDATVTTGAASNVDFADATMAGSASKYPADAKVGVVISASNNQEDVRAGLRVDAAELADNFSVTKQGLLPSATYYYAAFLDLGAGIVYGDVKEFKTAASDFDVDNDFVDLGLSVKWAKRNVGAKTATDFGGYFGFGDLYGVNPSLTTSDYAQKDTYKTTNDVAYYATNGKGTLPTADLFEELFRLCTVTWTEQDGVSGYLVKAKNGNSIFLPAAGKRIESTVSESGLHGYYLTGTMNKSNTNFAVDYEFTSSTGVRATRAVYEALSVRPVTVARSVKFDKEKLFTTWYLDNGTDGKQHVFEGPFTQFGVTDNWGTITNNEPNPYQSIHWEMGTTNGWVGYDYGVDYGSMTFEHGDDGKDYVIVKRKDADGNETEEKGVITIDEQNKTVDMGDIKVLCGKTWVGGTAGVRNVLSLTDDGLQIGIVADDTYQYSLNYYSQAKADADAAIKVNLICVGNDWGGTWGSQVDAIAPEELDGQHTFKYEGTCNGLKVNTIDFSGLMSRYPNAFVRIDDIKLDGQSIKFNANNFCYGDIENNGNYRVEMANVWGKTAKSEKIIASPFSNLTNTDNDPAFTFTSSLEVTYTIFVNGPVGTYLPTLITVNKSWNTANDWNGVNQGATFDVTLNTETAKYEVTKSKFDITYQDAANDYSAGSIMTFVQIADIYGFFPGMHCTLDALKLDGRSVSFDKSKVVDNNESPKYRLELWNMYGATVNSGCAFGTPADMDGLKVITELGFTDKMETSFTINSLFATPQF